MPGPSTAPGLATTYGGAPVGRAASCRSRSPPHRRATPEWSGGAQSSGAFRWLRLVPLASPIKRGQPLRPTPQKSQRWYFSALPECLQLSLQGVYLVGKLLNGSHRRIDGRVVVQRQDF